MLTIIRKLKDVKPGDVIAVSDNRNEAISWCMRIPNGNTLKVQTVPEGITTVRYEL